MTCHADHAAKIIAAARIRSRESGRRGGKDDHLADCRDGQAGNDQGTPSQQIPIVNREPRPTTAATQPVPRSNALPPNRSACRIAGSRTGGRPYRFVMHGTPGQAGDPAEILFPPALLRRAARYISGAAHLAANGGNLPDGIPETARSQLAATLRRDADGLIAIAITTTG